MSSVPTAAASVRRYTIAEGLIGGALINGVLNAGLGYLLFPGDKMPMFGVPGVAADIFGMAFGIAFATQLLLAPLLRKRRAAGKLAAGDLAPRLAAYVASWPDERWRRATLLGVHSALLFAPLTVLALWWAGIESVDRLTMTGLKGVFAGVVGGLVSPLIALAALSEPGPDSTTDHQRK